MRTFIVLLVVTLVVMQTILADEAREKRFWPNNRRGGWERTKNTHSSGSKHNMKLEHSSHNNQERVHERVRPIGGRWRGNGGWDNGDDNRDDGDN